MVRTRRSPSSLPVLAGCVSWLVALPLCVLGGCPAPGSVDSACQRDDQCPGAFICDRARAVCVRASGDAGPGDGRAEERAPQDALDLPDRSVAPDSAHADAAAADAAAAGDVASSGDVVPATDANTPGDAAAATDATTAGDTAAADVDTGGDAAALDAATPGEDAAGLDAVAPDTATAEDAAAPDAARKDAGVPSCTFPLKPGAQGCRPVRVLLLRDGSNAGSSLTSALTSAGFDVVSGGLYHLWDGAHPALDDRDTILVLQGTDFDHDLGAAAQAAILEFVAAGGGLVRTEWAAWRRAADPVSALLPVEGSPSYAQGFTWSIQDPAHPLARGLGDGFASQAGFDHATLRGEAEAVIRTQDGNHPIASYTREHGGTSVHLNHDVTFSTPLEPAFIALYLNAAWFSAAP